MASYCVEARGLTILFPTATTSVYNYGAEDELWPSIDENPAFRKEKAKNGETGWDLEGNDVNGVWRRWKQELDGGKLITILGGQNNA